MKADIIEDFVVMYEHFVPVMVRFNLCLHSKIFSTVKEKDCSVYTWSSVTYWK